MKLRLLLASASVAAAAFVLPATASAQGVIIDEGGVRVAPPYERSYDRYDRYDRDRYDQYDRGIGPRQARRIARGAGMDDVFDVDRRGRVWVVRGEDRRGRDMRVTISIRTGEVVDVRRAARG
jgi:hypothetical protein